MKLVKKNQAHEYDNLTIQQIESKASEALSFIINKLGEFVQLMLYLEKTSRYKQNPAYANSPFQHYIEGEHGMAWSKYHLIRKAYKQYPDEILTHGIDMVVKVLRNCEYNNQKKVFKLIGNKTNYIDKREIITTYARQSQKNGVVPVKSYEIANERLRTEVLGERTENNELRDQVIKLKKTVIEYKDKCDRCPYHPDNIGEQ